MIGGVSRAIDERLVRVNYFFVLDGQSYRLGWATTETPNESSDSSVKIPATGAAIIVDLMES